MCFTRRCSISLKGFCFEVIIAVCEWERVTEGNLCSEYRVVFFVFFLAAERFRVFFVHLFVFSLSY